MNIAILGGSGDVGSRTVQEALSRQHQVTAIGRSIEPLNKLPSAALKTTADANSEEDIINAAKSCDVLVSAVRPAVGHEQDLITMTQSALQAAAQMGARIIVVGGAARLRLSADSNDTVLTADNFLPTELKPIAQACQSQYELCLANNNANWTYLSPPAMLLPGERTGVFRLGQDTLVSDDSGQSTISIEDFAVALIDEIEKPNHVKRAFTVGY